MFDDSHSFITRAFLRAAFDLDYRAYTIEHDAQLLKRLQDWDGRLLLSETQAEGAFTQTFFVDTWGYGEAGRVPSEQHTIIAKLPVPGEGASGGAGEADLALGWFRGRRDATPQVLCEFKDIRSRLDAKQNRKGSTRSPVEQCLNYVRGARRGLFGNEPVQPWWGLVTDMNEFRLYWWDRAPAEYIRFFIRREDLLSGSYDLLGESEDARFDRYLFAKLFSRDMLLSEAGRPQLLRLVERQWAKGRKLEGEFYDRYKDVRERLYNVLRLNNPDFPGRPGELLRLTQRLLDRFIFAFYCENMGERLLFPPQLIRDFMRNRSNEPLYDESGSELWDQFKRVFEKMNTGGSLVRVTLPEINGGLFAPDTLIDGLSIPNHVFAKAGQGANEASLESDTNTLLYLCARYNYAARGDVKESLSLYTLGHIFEQSITELEYREGELEGRETVAKLSKRKRDGVYYTPEPVVNYLVEQTLGPWFADANPPFRPRFPPSLSELRRTSRGDERVSHSCAPSHSKETTMPEPTNDAWTQIRYDYEHTGRPVEDICAEHGISSGTLRDRMRRWRWAWRRAPIPREGPPAMALREMTCALPQHDSAAPSPWPLGPRLPAFALRASADGRGDERGEVAEETTTPVLAASTPTPTLPLAGGGIPAAPPHIVSQSATVAPDASDPASIAPRLQSAVARVLPAIETIIARLSAGPLHPREMEQTARALGTLTRTLRELNALLAQHPAPAAADDDPIPEDIDEFRFELARRIRAFIAARQDARAAADAGGEAPAER